MGVSPMSFAHVHCGVRDSNPQPPGWKPGALPIELTPPGEHPKHKTRNTTPQTTYQMLPAGVEPA